METSVMSAKEIFGWRRARAILWSVSLQAVFLIIYIFVINFNIWHPITWIQQSSAISLSFRTWQYFCLQVIFISVQGIFYCNQLLNQKYFRSRFSHLCNMFSLRNFCMAQLHIFSGGFMTYMYLTLCEGKFSNTTTICSTDDTKYCMIEGYLYLILNGVCVGVYFFVYNYLFGSKTLLFPVVEQLKFLQIKTELLPLFKQSLKDAFLPTIYFFMLYYCKADLFRALITYHLDYNVEEKSLITLFSLMSIFLFAYSWLFCSAYIFTNYMMMLLIQVNLTEHTAFPVTAALGNPTSVILYQALTSTDHPIIRFLGFLDLKILAEKDYNRRKELFALSQPGGHPYNWNAICEESLKLIRTFTDDINKAITEPQPTQESREQITTNEYFSGRNPFTLNESQNISISAMRNMSLKIQNISDLSFCQSPNPTYLQTQANSPELYSSLITNMPKESVGSVLRYHVTGAMDTLSKKPGISFVFGEIPDSKIKYHLAQGQLVIWAVESLAYLTAASFKEDCFGIVQKDLPAIITSLLGLKQTLDKIQKVGNYKKSQRADNYDIKIKFALRSAAKRSLYCICNTFGDYVKELTLSKDVVHQLQNFILYKEG